MNFKFNRKPLKEKIYKWYVCGYYDVNARAVEDNLTTNDVEEAKDFAWELVNRGDFVIVKNMHNGKSAIINEDDVFDDVSEYLNDIFRSIDGRTNESLKEGDYYRDNGFHRVEWGFMDEYDKSLIKDWLVSRHPEVIDDCIAYYGVHNFDDISNYNVWSWVSDTGNEALYDDFKRFLKHRNYNESLKEDANEKMVIYTQMGEYCVTPKSNYGGRMQNSRKVHHMKDFESAREVMDYWNKYFHTTDDDFIIIDNESLKEDISDYEIDKVYKKLSKLNKVDFGALEDEYLKTRPSLKDAVYKFYGTILNTKSYCKDFVKWAKEEKGIDLKGLKESINMKKRVNEDILPDEVYNKAWENAKRTYVVTARDAAPYHYEINTEYGIYAKIPNGEGFLAHWFLDTRSRDTVEEMEELASKYIRKYNCKKVSVQEYKKIVNGRR